MSFHELQQPRYVNFNDVVAVVRQPYKSFNISIVPFSKTPPWKATTSRRWATTSASASPRNTCRCRSSMSALASLRGMLRRICNLFGCRAVTLWQPHNAICDNAAAAVRQPYKYSNISIIPFSKHPLVCRHDFYGFTFLPYCIPMKISY